MGKRFESREDLAAKIEWEGGVLESVSYGIRAEHLPKGDDELAKLWAEMETAYQKAESAAEKIDRMLEGATPTLRDEDDFTHTQRFE